MAATNEPKPSLLVFSHLCNKDYVTGAEKLLLFMLHELRQMCACTLIVPEEGIIADRARALDIRVEVIPLPIVGSLYAGEAHMFEEMHQGMRGTAWAALVNLLLSRNPAAVLVNTSVHPLPAIAARALGIPVIWSLMEKIRITAHTQQAVHFISSHADRLLGISASTLASFQASDQAVQSAIIPPTWNMAELSPDKWDISRQSLRRQLGADDHHRLIGYVASAISENKGFHHFIDMALRVAGRHDNARFLIVGNPVDDAFFERNLDRARAAGVYDRFHWIRFEERIEHLYPGIDILVVPSLVPEGFGLTAQEAMAFGKPVVSYEAGGLAEIHVAVGSTDTLVPVGYVDGLAEKVGQLVADEGLRTAIGERNRSAVEEVYGLQSYRNRLHSFMAQFFAAGRLPVPRLLRGGRPTIYLREGGVLRPFRSEAALLAAGYRPDEARQVPDELIDVMTIGRPIGSGGRRKRRSSGVRRKPARTGARASKRGAGKLRRTALRRARRRLRAAVGRLKRRKGRPVRAARRSRKRARRNG